jgi:hypothetical protein
MSHEIDDNITPRIQGHVLIRDPNTDQVILDRKNAIHYENISLIIGYALAGNSSGLINKMAFGNGGSAVNGVGAITYFPTNTSKAGSNLYNATYTKAIVGDAGNFIQVKHLTGTTYTDVIVTCTLDYSEPAGQEAFDDANANQNGAFVFDEIGLKNGDGLLLTHVVFNPIQKSLNRVLEVIYTLRIQMG